jgi:hypothetical protein
MIAMAAQVYSSEHRTFPVDIVRPDQLLVEMVHLVWWEGAKDLPGVPCDIQDRALADARPLRVRLARGRGE